MTRRRRVPTRLALAMLLLVAGCSGKTDRAASPTSAAATSTAEPSTDAGPTEAPAASAPGTTKAPAKAAPAAAVASDGVFTENFAWKGTHGAFVGDGSTVWWNRDSWDVHADTHHNAVSEAGLDNRGDPKAQYNDTQPKWPWKGFHVDIHKANSADPRDGKVDNTKGVAGGDGAPGLGIMHLDFQGILSARLRNPVLISSSRPAEVSFYAPRFVTTGYWWEVAISPASEIVGGENTAVPGRFDPEHDRFESLPSPFKGDKDQGASTNGPGHRDWVADSINVISTGFPDVPDCKEGDKFGWRFRFGATKAIGGKVETLQNLVDSMDQLPKSDPSERNKLYPWKVVFKPDRVTLYGDLDENGQMEVRGDYAMQISWSEVFVHLLGAMYQGDHHPQWGCGYNENNGVTQVAELQWRQVRIGPVKYKSTAAFPREATGSNGPRTAGFMSYDIRDIGRQGGPRQGQPQANSHAYDKYSDYAWCWPASSGIECGDEARAKQDVPLKLTLSADDLAGAAHVRVVADVRYSDPIKVDVNGKPVGSLVPVVSKRDDFEREAWVRRGVNVDKTLLRPGENTITLHMGASSEIDRIELEVARQ